MKSTILRLLLLASCQMLAIQLYSQIELEKVAPMAPNTSALLRVAENRVNHYTGAADISMPLYTIQSGKLQLPLALTYSSTGNKVENIASWVGLGWSLGTIPVVSRSVRGLSDEHYPGVSVPYANGGGPIPLDSLLYIEDAPGHPLNMDVRCGITNRQIDTEPDMFHYTLLDGKSGNFYWDPFREKYQTHPFRNVRIDMLGSGSIDGFEIIDDIGNIYVFNAYETSQSSGTYSGPTERNAWYVGKIYSPNRKDSIVFGYSTESIVTKTINPHKQEFVSTCADNSSIISTTTVQARIPYSIQFPDGVAEFIVSSNQREDLQGSYALKELKVTNYKGQVVKRILMDHFYTTGISDDPLCNLISSFTHEKKRLFLSGFNIVGSGTDTLKYQFEYNTSIQAPCRASSAQDFWGYYNGELYNENLVPEVPKGVYGVPYKTVGAKRYINPDYNQFGILNTIYYPTGGRSEFVYETHKMYNNNLPGIYNNVSAYLTEEHETATDIFIDTIEIVSTRDTYINNSDDGGSFVDIILGDKTCAGMSPPPGCANFTVRGIDVGNNDINFPVSSDIVGHHLKKGRYEIKASFTQGYIGTQGFFMLVKWRERDTSGIHRYAGGLRVKEIRQYDSLGNRCTKAFLYQKSISNDTSSAVPLSSTNMIMLGLNECYAIPSDPESGRADQFFIYSTSKATLGSYGGSYVAYNHVIELYDSASSNGYSEFSFFNFGVHVNEEMPFIPPDDYTEFRAKPTRIAQYRKNGSGFDLLGEETYTYDELFFTDIQYDALKAYITLIPPAICDPLHPISGQFYIGGGYQMLPNLCRLNQKTTRVYDPDNGVTLITDENYYYNEINYELEKVVTADSKGNTIEKLNFYAVDTTASGLDNDVWAAMIAKNMISLPTKVVSKVAGSTTEMLINKYDYESTPDKVLLKELFHSYKDLAPVSEVQFTYSASDRLIEQQRTNNVKEVYLWGYGFRYPVAKIVGTTYATASGYINQAILDNPASDEALRTHLAALRTIPDVMVETYTYKPLVGVTSITDPRGRTTYYTYDGHNRLAYVLDHDKKVLKKFCYSYTGQPENCTEYYSVVKSGNFTRNNCGVGYTGSSVMYTVPAGTYTSMGSQADADALAQADVDANGQAYANANGTCTQSIYARLTYENYNYSYSHAVHADVVVRFYSDAAGTVPLSVTNLTIQLSTEGFNGSSTFSYDYPETVSGTSFMVEASAELSYDDGVTFRFRDYYLLSGSGYIVLW